MRRPTGGPHEVQDTPRSGRRPRRAFLLFSYLGKGISGEAATREYEAAANDHEIPPAHADGCWSKNDSSGPAQGLRSKPVRLPAPNLVLVSLLFPPCSHVYDAAAGRSDSRIRCLKLERNPSPIRRNSESFGYQRAFQCTPRPAARPIWSPPAVAIAHRPVYCRSQDDFFLQPIFIYLPLLAHNSGLGGVASSEPLHSLRALSTLQTRFS